MKQEFGETVQRASLTIPFFVKAVVLWRLVTYLISWFIDLSSLFKMNATSLILFG